MHNLSKAAHTEISSNAGILHHSRECKCESGDHSACGLCCTKIEHLGVKFGSATILENINLHIHCGEFTALIGRNGTGKTTFLRALLGEIPHTGTITFEKNNLNGSKNRPRFGYVPQKLHVAEGSPISVADLVQSCLSRRPVWLSRRKKDTLHIEQTLSATETSHLLERRLCDLSGGELQRVMLSLALNPQPDILLLDEPVSGVDRRALIAFYEVVSDIRKKNDSTILLVSHDLDLAARHADRVVLFTGASAIDGNPQFIFKTPEFAEAFGYVPEEFR